LIGLSCQHCVCGDCWLGYLSNAVMSVRDVTHCAPCTGGYLSFGPIEKLCFYDITVIEKDWRSREGGAKAA
jgi:hypothetical protein